MSAVYPAYKESLLSALTSGTVKAALMKSSAAYNAAHDFYDDISADVLATVTVTGKSVTAGVFDAGDVTFSAVAGGNTGDAIVLYIDSGSAATSRLIAWIDGNSLSTNGGNITVTWSNGDSKIFAI
jgi:hypothetical protein